MANILDYLKWRGDLTFRASSLNEVDNLIFAVFSYADMDDYMDMKTSMTLKEAADKYVELEIDQSDLPYNPKPLILAAAETDRYKDVVISRYINIIDYDRKMQFAAMCFRYDEGKSFVAFRGTDNTFIGWHEDLDFSAVSATNSQLTAAGYFDLVAGSSDDEFVLGGHSKGGNLAQFAAMYCKPENLAKIRRIYSDDGPGFRQEILNSSYFENIRDLCIHIVPDASIIGMLMNNPVKKVIVSSSAPAHYQHDPFSWNVLGTQFVHKDKLTGFSLFIEDTVDRWLDDLSDADRLDFIDTVFSAIDSTGISTISQIKKKPLTNYSSLINALAKEDPQTQQQILDVIRKLAKAGTDVFIDNLKAKFDEIQNSLNSQNDHGDEE